MTHTLILIILLILIIIGCTPFGRHSEKKTWNNGICKETGLPWICFDMDSQGGRGYKSGSHYCWISYNVDKIKTPKLKTPKLKNRFQLLKGN